MHERTAHRADVDPDGLRAPRRDDRWGSSAPSGIVRRQRDGADGRPLTAASVLALQRAVGNQAVGGLLTRTAPTRLLVQRDDDETPASTGPLRAGSRLLPGSLWLADPAEFLRDKPSLVPSGGLPPLPPSLVEGLIDWGGVGTAYRDRELVLDNRDRAVIVAHWQRWYPVAQALYKLPGAKSLFDTPAAIMNTMSAKMIDSSLAGDQPNLIERFNQQAEQFGVKTSTVSVTVKHF